MKSVPLTLRQQAYILYQVHVNKIPVRQVASGMNISVGSVYRIAREKGVCTSPRKARGVGRPSTPQPEEVSRFIASLASENITPGAAVRKVMHRFAKHGFSSSVVRTWVLSNSSWQRLHCLHVHTRDVTHQEIFECLLQNPLLDAGLIARRFGVHPSVVTKIRALLPKTSTVPLSEPS